MTDRSGGATGPGAPDRQAQGDETPDTRPRSDAVATFVPSQAGDTVPTTVPPQHPAPAGTELGAPEISTVGDSSGARSDDLDREPTQVMSRNDRLAALVAQTRIRTGKYPVLEQGTSRAPPESAISSADAPTSAGLLDAAPAPQSIDEAEPTEKNRAPGEGRAEASTFGEAVSRKEDRPAVDASGVVPSRRRLLVSTGAGMVVAGALVWFAVAWVLPRYRILASDVSETVHHPAPPTPVKEVPAAPAPERAEPSAATATSPPVAPPVAPRASGPVERPPSALATSRIKPVGAAHPRSKAKARAKATATVRPERSQVDDPDGTLPPRGIPRQPDTPDPPARGKTTTRN